MARNDEEKRLKKAGLVRVPFSKEDPTGEKERAKHERNKARKSSGYQIGNEKVTEEEYKEYKTRGTSKFSELDPKLLNRLKEREEILKDERTEAAARQQAEFEVLKEQIAAEVRRQPRLTEEQEIIAPELQQSQAPNIAPEGSSVFQQQFEAGGGFQELDTRGERLVERGAEAGLSIPAFIAKQNINLINDIFGTDYEPESAESLAETKTGKLLGNTILISGAIGGYQLAAPTISAGIGLATTKLAAAFGVSQGAALVGFGGAAAWFSGLSADDIKDGVLKRESLNDIKGGLSEYGEIGTDIAAQYQGTSLATRAKGAAQINEVYENLLIIEHKAQQAVLLEPTIAMKSEYINDFLPDIENKKQALADALEALYADAPELSPEEKNALINEQLNKYNQRRQKLISEGKLKNVI